MLATFSSANYADLLIMLSGALLCLKRVAEMERYHTLRVVVLTLILSYFVILFSWAMALRSAIQDSGIA
jgi:hypothetical protein